MMFLFEFILLVFCIYNSKFYCRTFSPSPSYSTQVIYKWLWKTACIYVDKTSKYAFFGSTAQQDITGRYLTKSKKKLQILECQL